MSSTRRMLITEGSLEDIGDAIRMKIGTDSTFLPSMMAPAIRSIPTGGIAGEGTIPEFKYSLGMIAPVEESITVSQAYAVGEYFIYGLDLYVVTSAMAQGDEITPDTNCTKLCIADKLTPFEEQINDIFGDIATVESSTTASKNYSAGDYLAYNGKFYIVTASVTQGNSFASSITQTTVAEQLEKLKDNLLFFSDVSVSASSSASNIVSKSDSRITSDHVVVECVFAAPSNITSDLTWTTSAGSLIMNGTCSAATTATITLAKKAN